MLCVSLDIKSFIEKCEFVDINQSNNYEYLNINMQEKSKKFF